MPRESTRESGRDSISDDRLRQLHSQYVESRKKTNESADLAFDRVAQSLKAQAEKLKQQYPSRTIDFEVVVKDGRTVLKPIVRAK